MKKVRLTVGDSGGPEEGRQFLVRVQIAGPERDRSFGVANERAGIRADSRQPIRNILRIPDRGGQQQQACLGRTEDQGLFPHHPAFRVGEVLGFVHDHQPQGIQAHVDFTPRRIVEQIAQYFRGHNEQGCLGMLPAVAGEDADLPRSE